MPLTTLATPQQFPTHRQAYPAQVSELFLYLVLTPTLSGHPAQKLWRYSEETQCLIAYKIDGEPKRWLIDRSAALTAISNHISVFWETMQWSNMD